MLRMAWRAVAHARGRAVALAAGILIAAVAFALLTAAVDVNTARITGTVAANWRGTYDLVVLPSGPASNVPGNHLVQVNYLSASGGGITDAQYQEIAKLPGVGVAAPLAIVGYILETVDMPVPLDPAAIAKSGARVLAVSSQVIADQGLSKYPAQPSGYVYITPNPLSARQLNQATSVAAPSERLPDGKTVPVCGAGLNETSGAATPFAGVTDTGLDVCYSRATGQPGTTSARASGPVSAEISWSFPVLVAGIDPSAENALTGLGGALTAGHYLSEAARLTPMPVPGSAGSGNPGVIVPVLGSSTSFDGDSDRVTVRLLPPSAVTQASSGGSPLRTAAALGAEHGTPVELVTIGAAAAWQALLAKLAEQVTAHTGSLAQAVGQYWSAGPATLRPGSGGQMAPSAVTNLPSVWKASFSVNDLRYVSAPPAAADTGFRALTPHTEAGAKNGAHGAASVTLRLAGEFNPAKLPGFTGGGPGAPLASYRAPTLTGADAASRQALGDASLEPDGNMAGYPQQPPLLYTTLPGARALEGSSGSAPISSVRVRITGLRGSVPEQLAKVGAVGAEITRATGLRAVVMAGASPAPVTIGLPAGKYGRPALSLTSDWTETGVALFVLRQADRESLALFVLVLVVCALFLVGAAVAGVRGRRAEIGALRAVGWGRRQVFGVILSEVTLLGLVAGVLGAGLSAALITGLGLHVPLWRATLVLPVALVLGAGSGAMPAWLASRVQPAAAFAPPARAPRRGGRRVRSVTGLAVTGVARFPGRCALAGAGLAVGVLALTVLLAARVSFGTSIGDSSLAGLVTSSTRGADLAAALLTVGLSAVAVADLAYLGARERAAELAALAAAGWDRWPLGRLLGTEAALVAGLGAATGAAAGLAVAGAAFGLSLAVVLAAVAAGLGGTMVSVAATAAVLALTASQPVTAVLAMDE
jgi:putative ABC transport system permease protein